MSSLNSVYTWSLEKVTAAFYSMQSMISSAIYRIQKHGYTGVELPIDVIFFEQVQGENDELVSPPIIENADDCLEYTVNKPAKELFSEVRKRGNKGGTLENAMGVEFGNNRHGVTTIKVTSNAKVSHNVVAKLNNVHTSIQNRISSGPVNHQSKKNQSSSSSTLNLFHLLLTLLRNHPRLLLQLQLATSLVALSLWSRQMMKEKGTAILQLRRLSVHHHHRNDHT